ncbi:MAG: hypothetical protein GX900_08350 [Clostridiaceae bacterium]|mgnify:CR=1 FL=1|nr:hypothetical protein [Clostridiaceae bacterium]
MSDTLVVILNIVMLLSLAVGALIIAAAKPLVRRFNLAERQRLPKEMADVLTEEEARDAMFQQALMKLKLYGTAALIPGTVLAFILYK